MFWSHILIFISVKSSQPGLTYQVLVHVLVHVHALVPVQVQAQLMSSNPCHLNPLFGLYIPEATQANGFVLGRLFTDASYIIAVGHHNVFAPWPSPKA